MNDSKIPVRYSKALFFSAKEASVEERVLKDLEFFRSTLNENGFRKFLESPVIKTSEKKKLIKKVYSKYIHTLTLHFFELILTNKREVYLEAIIRDFISLYREEHGIKFASLKTPFTVTPDMRKSFVTLLEKTFLSKIEMEEIVDPAMIGGFVLKIEDQQFDASIRSSLARMKKKLTENI